MTLVDWRNLAPVSEEEQPIIPATPSQTFLAHHDACDRSAMLYLKYRAGAGSHPLNRGAAFHDVVAKLTADAVKRGENTIPPEVGKDELRAYFAANPEVQMSAQERDACRMMIAHWCEATWLDPSQVIAVESTLTLEIGGYTVVGRVDLAEQDGRTLTITDYKTSYSMPDSDEFEAQSFSDDGVPHFAGNFQTQLYALLAAFGIADDGLPLAEGIDRFKVQLLFPRHLRLEGLADRSAVITREKLTDYRFDVEDQLRRLREVNDRQRKWQPTPGNHCRICPAEYACPLPKVLRPESQHASLDTLEDLEKAGANWYFMSERARRFKARIKKAAERLGETDPDALELPDGEAGVYIGDDLALVFRHKESEKVRDKAKLAENIEATTQYGKPFNWADNFTTSQGTEFVKRRVQRRPQPKTPEPQETPDAS